MIINKQIDEFVNFLQDFVELSDHEIKDYLQPIIEIRAFEKKKIIIAPGDTENYINYINKGILRKYYFQDGEEMITQISTEGHLISSQESFYTRSPSEYFIEAIEPAILLSINYYNLEKLFSLSPSFERLGRLVAIHTLVQKDKWVTSLLKLTPRERFLRFINNNPEMLQRVPQKYLASYLNIKPETFSRFKHLLRNNGR